MPEPAHRNPLLSHPGRVLLATVLFLVLGYCLKFHLQMVHGWTVGPVMETPRLMVGAISTRTIAPPPAIDLPKPQVTGEPDAPAPDPVSPPIEVIPEPEPIPATWKDAAHALKVDIKAEGLPAAANEHLEDPHHSLRTFFASLEATRSGEEAAQTRVLHFGDSIVVMDFIAGSLRRRLQRLAGDAGHGYLQPARERDSYMHWDVHWRPGGGWRIDSIMKNRKPPRWLGLGGMAFDATGAGAWMEAGGARRGKWGRQVSSMTVYYLKQPQGGSFQINANSGESRKVSTAWTPPEEAEITGADRLGVATLTVPPGAHTFRLNTTGGRVRILATFVEDERPGVILDTLGVLGARSLLMQRIEPSLWEAQLQARQPDLVIWNFGANEADDRGRSSARTEKDYQAILQRIREAVPEASVLVMSALDRAERRGGGIRTFKNLPGIVRAQRAAALATGCAFYNTFEAMGGEGTMVKWNRQRPKLVSGDWMHPTRRGADVLGNMVYHALLRAWLEEVAAGMEPRLP